MWLPIKQKARGLRRGFRDLDRFRRQPPSRLKCAAHQVVEIAAPRRLDSITLGPRACQCKAPERYRPCHSGPGMPTSCVGDVFQCELFERRATKADDLGFFGRLLDRPSILQHALDQPHRADTACGPAVDVNRLIGLVRNRRQKLIDNLVVGRLPVERQVNVVESELLGACGVLFDVGAGFRWPGGD